MKHRIAGIAAGLVLALGIVTVAGATIGSTDTTVPSTDSSDASSSTVDDSMTSSTVAGDDDSATSSTLPDDDDDDSVTSSTLPGDDDDDDSVTSSTLPDDDDDDSVTSSTLPDDDDDDSVTSSTLPDDDDDDDRVTDAADGTYTYEVPGVGSVTIRVSAGTLWLVSVDAPEWSTDIETKSDEIKIEFRQGSSEAEFEADLEDGGLEIEIDPAS